MTEDTPPKLDYATPHSNSEWVTVKTYQNSLEAELAVALLQRQGILVHVLGQNTNAAFGAIYGPGIAKITLQVPAEEEESARRMLEEIEEKRRQRMQPRTRCPKCGGAGKQSPSRQRILVGLSVAIIGFLAAVFLSQFFCVLVAVGFISLVWPVTPRWKCGDCGHEWRAPEPKDQDGDDE